MAIGSKVIGSSVVAGQYGIIQSQAQLAGFSQIVQLVDPAKTLATIEQSVLMVDKAKTLARFTQRVVASDQVIADIFVPYGYVELNGIILTCETPANNIRVTHNEDQSSTASMNVTYPTGIQINIPSFHGKPVRILVHEDSGDIESELIPLFTGWVESAKHDLATQSIDFTCSDLRDERLGREDGQRIRQMTGALYSTITQRENVSGRDYVTELMRTAAGSLNYTRDGDLRYHSWGTTGKPVDFIVTDDHVSYNDLNTEFQTRSEVRNSVTITMQYRYGLLRTVETEVDAYKERMLRDDSAPIAPFDLRMFDRDQLLQKIESLGSWELISHEFYPLERFRNYRRRDGSMQYVLDAYWQPYGKKKYSQGIKATLKRRVTQPVREEYTIKLIAPQSIDAYGEEVEGSSHNYAIDTEFDRKLWEEDYKEANKRNAEASRAAVQAQADNKRLELQQAFNAAYLIGRKELVASHRKNYCSWVRHDIDPRNLGDIVQLDHRIVQTTGQLVGLEYRIADGVRQTSYRIAVSYMDTSMQPPAENWTPPSRPAALQADVSIDSTAEYNTEEGAFDLEIGDISEQYTDEIEQKRSGLTYDVPLEIDGITLING